MSRENSYTYRSEQNPRTLRIDWDCLLRDLLRGWWTILLTGLMAALMTGAVMLFRYVPQYTAETTFAISQTGFSYSQISANLSQAATTSEQFSQVVSSSILRNQVCEDLGISGFPASVSVNTIESSNLMEMTVTASSPQMAYEISRSVIDNSVELMGYFLDGVVMKEIQSTVIPESPSNPLRLGPYMGIAAVAGIVVMGFILSLFSVYKDTIKNVDDVSRKVDAKLLGTIYYENKRKRGMKKKAAKEFSLLLTNPMLSFMYVESYRMLAARVRFAMDAEDRKVLMVTSVSENEGKSTVAANIAVALAQEGKKVFLADCDFRKPAQYKIFGFHCPGSCDFCTAISRREKVRVVQQNQIPGLAVAFGKQPAASQMDKDSFTYLEKIVKKMKARYDYIILDTAPMAFVADTEEYAALADASLLVIRQDVMETCYINDAIDALDNTGTKLIGCVFNGVRQGLAERAGVSGSYGAGSYGKYSHYNKSGSRAGNENERI